MKSRGSVGLIVALVALFIALPLIEVYLLIQVGRGIGVWPTLAILVAEAALGGWLMRREGARAWQALSGAFNRGTLPSRELADAALVLVGGLMLMLPGFMTDIVGLICLIPLTRFLPRRVIAWVAAQQAAKRGLDLSGLRNRGTVIDGEVIPGDVVDGTATDAGMGREGSVADRPQPNKTPVIEGRVIEGRVVD